MQRFAFLVNHFFTYFLLRLLLQSGLAFPSVAALFRCVFSGEANYIKDLGTLASVFQ